jgi:SET domain
MKEPEESCSSSTSSSVDDAPKANHLSSSSYHGPFLLPVIDLLNHTTNDDKDFPSCTTLQRDASTGTFHMVAERPIAAGEQVVHSYGDALTSAQVLQTFGFVPHSYMEDRAFMTTTTFTSTAAATSSQQEKSAHQTITPAMLSKIDLLLPACRRVALSDYPKQLIHRMKTQGLNQDEIWNVRELFEQDDELTRRSMSHISNDLAVSSSSGGGDQKTNNRSSFLSEELITVLCAQFLPHHAYQDLFHNNNNDTTNGTIATGNTGGSSLLDASILEDYFLGNLVCQSLLVAIDEKLRSYQPVTTTTALLLPDTATTTTDDNMDQDDNGTTTLLDRDRTLLRQLLQIVGSTTKATTKTEAAAAAALSLNQLRAMYGLTVRIEELMCLIGLREEVLAIENCLAQGYSIDAATIQNLPSPDKEDKDEDGEDVQPATKRLKISE